MKWAILGTGWISDKFVEELKTQEQQVNVVYSRTFEKGKAFANKHNIKHVVTSLEDEKLLHNVDTCYIASPNSIHFEQANVLLKKNKHLIIEKPLTHDYQKTQDLFNLAKENNLKILESYCHITNPSFNKFLELSPKEFRTNFMQVSSKLKNDAWKIASSFSIKHFGGAIPDIGVYPLSAAIYLMGSVKKFELSSISFMNKVEVDITVKLSHVNGGNSLFIVSKIRNGDKSLYLDGKKVLSSISMSYEKRRFKYVIENFLKNTDFLRLHEVSLETARVVSEMKNALKEML